MICADCTKSLKEAHKFITRVHHVNERYIKFLADGQEDPLLENDVGNKLSDCLEESAIDMPVDHYLDDIKLEVVGDQYGILLLDKDVSAQLEKNGKQWDIFTNKNKQTKRLNFLNRQGIIGVHKKLQQMRS